MGRAADKTALTRVSLRGGSRRWSPGVPRGSAGPWSVKLVSRGATVLAADIDAVVGPRMWPRGLSVEGRPGR